MTPATPQKVPAESTSLTPPCPTMSCPRNILPPPSTPPAEFYAEGQGDLLSRLITPITHTVTLVILITNPLTKSPPPPRILSPQQHGHWSSPRINPNKTQGSGGLGFRDPTVTNRLSSPTATFSSLRTSIKQHTRITQWIPQYVLQYIMRPVTRR